jgi:hypothetical protein
VANRRTAQSAWKERRSMVCGFAVCSAKIERQYGSEDDPAWPDTQPPE